MSLFNYPKVTNEIPEMSKMDTTNYKVQRWNVRQNTDLEQNSLLEPVDQYAIRELNSYHSGTNPSGLFNRTFSGGFTQKYGNQSGYYGKNYGENSKGDFSGNYRDDFNGDNFLKLTVHELSHIVLAYIKLKNPD